MLLVLFSALRLLLFIDYLVDDYLNMRLIVLDNNLLNFCGVRFVLLNRRVNP